MIMKEIKTKELIFKSLENITEEELKNEIKIQKHIIKT